VSSDRLSNLNKTKTHFRVADTSKMPIGNTVIHIQFHLPEFIMNFSFIWVLRM